MGEAILVSLNFAQMEQWITTMKSEMTEISNLGDGWSDTCITKFCSDGTVNNNNEEWDGGNLNNDDGWDSSWITKYYGDGTVNNNNQEWDHGNSNSGDGWSSSWITGYWFDGLVNNNEECDDNNASKGDGCSEACLFEHDYIWAGNLTTTSVFTKSSVGYTHNSNHSK